MDYNGSINREANERVAFQYFTELLAKSAPEWRATHTKGEYDRYDITATDGCDVVYTETKIRHTPMYVVRNEGAIIDVGKVENLKSKGRGAVVLFFEGDNETYVWNVADSDNWKIGTKVTRKNNWSVGTEIDWVYYMPIDEQHRRPNGPDLSDYRKRYDDEVRKITAERWIEN